MPYPISEDYLYMHTKITRFPYILDFISKILLSHRSNLGCLSQLYSYFAFNRKGIHLQKMRLSMEEGIISGQEGQLGNTAVYSINLVSYLYLMVSRRTQFT